MKRCTCHILAGNNEKTIRDCLESAIRPGLFSQIIVLLDTRTKDRTGRILRDYENHYPRVKVFLYKWEKPPNFAKVRNDAIRITRTPYAFWLDSDEILLKPEQLHSMLHRANGQAFQMWVISPVQNGEFHNMYQPRLFPVAPGVFFECPVFERVDWSLRRSGVRIEQTQFDPLWHPGYTDLKTLERKNQRNVSIMEKYLREHRRNDAQRDHILTQYRRLKA